MTKFASACRSVLAAVLLAAMASTLVAAAEPAQEGEPAPAEPDNLECHDEAVSGSGPGFTSSPERSEQEAIDGWLAKAKAIYPEATWEMAKDKKMGCARQGLYSKCFVDAVPCHPKPEGGGE